ncbi:cellulase family glycosylhydrolase [Aureitalea sp. L0-47]|uniref:cellulase family glycosylhydrolase n=1 Tax=Aureitalea sp. L0-47 TaxID=2816962 RepID=UPI0022375768|nr:cellulase family glycosylhydrolase [Aureitalea sp. L0-47]MCW5518602.1 cellulase family glycosylhydrolase [Aureitalea sp. L0-47]
MRISRKITSRILIIAGFVLLNALLLLGIGEIYSFLNSGASKSSIFHGDLEGAIDYHPEISWDSLQAKGGTLSLNTIDDIINDYKIAWFVRNNALFTGDQNGLDDMYTENAREKLKELIRYNSEMGISIESTTLSHNLQFDLISADGKLVAFTDLGMRSYSRLWKDGNIQAETNELASYKLVMLLEDGFWRIRHMERFQSGKPITSIYNYPKAKLPEQLNGINYYPQQTPWNTFGKGFDPTIIQEDFRKIKELRLNAIRVFVNYEDFGSANVLTEKLDKLQQLLDIATANELHVIVTLFDFYGDYSVRDWTSTLKHANQLVCRFKDHPAVLSWDVKNEPDLDFSSRGKKEVVAWLEHMSHYIKVLDPGSSVTIGWSNPEDALLLEDEVDYLSFHFYRDLDGLQEAIDTLKSRTTKPLVLQELGLSSDFGLWNIFGHNQSEQAEYYDQFLSINQYDGIHFLTWTLYDFHSSPKTITGGSPWKNSKQSNFGLIDVNGDEKEAFDVIRDRD